MNLLVLLGFMDLGFAAAFVWLDMYPLAIVASVLSAGAFAKLFRDALKERKP